MALPFVSSRVKMLLGWAVLSGVLLAACGQRSDTTAAAESAGGDAGTEAGGDGSAAAPSACKRGTAEWLASPEWPAASLTLGTKTYARSDIATVLAGPDTDASIALARALVGAMLNYAAGAKPSGLLAAAQAWLDAHETAAGLPFGVPAAGAPDALALANALAAYNVDGRACEYVATVPVVRSTCDPRPAAPDPIVPPSLAVPGGFVRAEARSGVVTNLYGAISLPGAATDAVADRVSAFLDANKGLFGIDKVATDLEFVESVDLDTGGAPSPFATKPNGNVRVRYRRTIDGHPVVWSNVSVTVDRGGAPTDPAIRFVMTALPSGAAITNIALLSPQDAIVRALAGTHATHASVETVVFNPGILAACPDDNRLAYKVTFTDRGRGDPAARIVDPGHGGILYEFGAPTAAQDFQIFTMDPADSTREVLLEMDQPPPAYFNEPLYSSNPDFAKLYSVLKSTYSFYMGDFGRDMHDGQGGLVVVRYLFAPNSSKVGTAWIDPEQAIQVGPARDVDPAILTHELGHGVLYSMGIPYNVYGQSGAIQEALADLFGFWHIGAYANIYRDATVPRCLDPGPPCPANVQDIGPDFEAHTESTIISHAAYCAAQGVGQWENIPIVAAGDPVVEQVFYEAAKLAPATFEALRTAIRNVAWRAADNDESLRGVHVTYANCGSLLNAFAQGGIGTGDRDYDCFSDDKDNCPDTYNPQQDDVCHGVPEAGTPEGGGGSVVWLSGSGDIRCAVDLNTVLTSTEIDGPFPASGSVVLSPGPFPPAVNQIHLVVLGAKGGAPPEVHSVSFSGRIGPVGVNFTYDPASLADSYPYTKLADLGTITVTASTDMSISGACSISQTATSTGSYWNNVYGSVWIAGGAP